MHMLERHNIAGNDYVFLAAHDDNGVYWFHVKAPGREGRRPRHFGG